MSDSESDHKTIVYAVVFSNYSPSEVDSLWESKEDAERRVEELEESGGGDMWEVSPMTVFGKENGHE